MGGVLLHRFAPLIDALFVQLFDLLFVFVGEFRLSGNILAAAARRDTDGGSGERADYKQAKRM